MIEEAKKAKEESERSLNEAKKQLKEAEIKFKETIKIAEETAKKEREAALSEAKEIAERIKAQAKETVEVEVKKGQAKLKEYAVQKALEASEKVIKEKINPATNKTVVKNVIKQLEA
jgi:F-type H+-transporting ATPase subunit b